MKFFYHNYLFEKGIPKECLQHDKHWWEWPWLFLFPTYVQIGSNGKVYFYKQWNNQYYLLKTKSKPNPKTKI